MDVLDLEHAVGGGAVPNQHDRTDDEIRPRHRVPDLRDLSVVAVVLDVEPVFFHQVGLLLLFFADCFDLALVFQPVVGLVPYFTLLVLFAEFVEVHAGECLVVENEQATDVVDDIEPVILRHDAPDLGLIHEVHEVGRIFGHTLVIGFCGLVFEILVGILGVFSGEYHHPHVQPCRRESFAMADDRLLPGCVVVADDDNFRDNALYHPDLGTREGGSHRRDGVLLADLRHADHVGISFDKIQYVA